MKLYYSPTSPYARKARIVLREKQLTDMVEEIPVNPWSGDDEVAELRAVNPLGKVPALMGPAGEPYYDSRVVCAYLDAQGPGAPLVPADGEERFRVLRAEALADGVVDAAVSLVLEGRRPLEQRSDRMSERWNLSAMRGVSAMSEALPYLPREVTLAHVAFAAALAYLDFRLPDLPWRDGHDGLAQWYADFSARPSFIETAPPRT